MKFRHLIIPAAVVFSLIGASAASAATTATQNVTFTVAKAVALTSGGNVTTTPSSIDPSSGTPTGSATGSLTVSSNDASGFQLATKTSASTVTESGCASPTANANVNVMTVATGAASGGTGGAGTAASAVTLSTTNQNLYSSVPTMIGSSIAVATNYVITPGYATPANSSGCSYVIPVTYTITAQ